MNRLLGLAVLLAAGYFAYTWAWPRLAENLELRPAAESARLDPETAAEARRCVAEASGLNDLLAQEIRGLRPGSDPTAWSDFFLVLTSETARVRSLCACSPPACDKATQALEEVAELALQFNSAMRGEAGGWSNPASRQERIHDLLDQARRLLVE